VDTAIALMTATFPRDGAVLQFISSLGFDAAGRGGFLRLCDMRFRGAFTGSAAVANGKAALKPRAATNSQNAASKFVVLRIEICYPAQR